MKVNLVVAAVLLLLIASISSPAQTRPGAPPPATPTSVAPQPVTTANVPVTKIALIDTSMFGDEKAGIKRYLNAVKSVQAQFQPRTTELLNLQNRIKTIADEITKLSGNAVVGQQTIRDKQQEGESLQRELKYKKDQVDADVEKRYTEVVSPISADIGKALDQYAIQHGLTMILDISKLLPAILTVNPATDVTQ